MAEQELKDVGGRPSKLDESVYEGSENYLFGGWEEEGDELPTVEGLALYLGVSRSSVKLWASQDDRFSATVERIKATQAKRLINKGLNGDFNSAITKLLLNNHGYTEKVETQNIHSFESLSDDELAAKIESFKE